MTDRAKPQIRISVRNMIEFLMRSGDICLAAADTKAMQQGTLLHRKLQEEAGENYRSEVRLAVTEERESFSILVEGIADGIIQEDERVIIDEIKTTSMPLDLIDENFSGLHWAQAKCYGWMYLSQNQAPYICIRLTYCRRTPEADFEVKQFLKEYSFEELNEYFTGIVNEYAKWVDMTLSHRKVRDRYIQDLAFPFPQYRKGQRRLAAEVYKAIRYKRLIFVQAPTGVGKTISVLFPAVKAMAEGMGEKIFYLTAKTVTRQVAEDTIRLMKEKGLCFRSLTLTARDKICFLNIPDCNPEACTYARGHYDRVNAAIMDILKNEDIITREIVLKYAAKHHVCPFEYALDIALWADAVICDYNHVFDPRAYLRRFFDSQGDYVLLIDEAHNLPERARDMFSASLNKQAFIEHRKQWKQSAPELYQAFSALNKWFIAIRKSFEKSYDARLAAFPTDFLKLVRTFAEELEACLLSGRQSPSREMTDLLYDCRSFLAVADLFDDRYLVHLVRSGSDVEIKLLCADPSFLLRKSYEKNRSAVFFSGTLQPLYFYKETLGGRDEDRAVSFPSPFPAENLCLMIAGNISTRYRDREESYEEVARYIRAATKMRVGNYLVFFPSYQYLKNVLDVYLNMWPDDKVIVQKRNMDDREREEFLNEFHALPAERMTAFAVMGGIFSEGIDLTGERLSGAVIVGVGLPQISAERDLISRYYQENRGSGFEYAYMLPGLNRVMQAAGRVIRTEEDRGFVLLLDDRFLHKRYLDEYPAEWKHYICVKSPDEVEKVLSEFW
ncbi:MAG: ATP-dependent DNA helicase [Clostridiales bacterium]|jgi:DNA excision repair protein ERCC-2|nr:ATP-dependent DNA helicase [Clostridiales bacterium]